MNGELNKTEDRYEVCFERTLEHPIETVWGALSEPEHLQNWLNVVEFEDEVGGAFVTEHDDADDRAEDRILRIDPPHLLEHTWWEEMNPDGVVRWELESHPEGCLLTLTYAAPPESSDDWGRDMAGWHVMVELLAAYLDGVPVSEHQRPSMEASGKRSGGTGVYAQFDDLRTKYSKLNR